MDLILGFPRFEGVILSEEWKEALWDKFSATISLDLSRFGAAPLIT